MEDQSKKRAFARNAMARSVAIMNRQKKRILAVISGLLTILGLGVIAVSIAGAVFIAEAELCKFPNFELVETYRFIQDNNLVRIRETKASPSGAFLFLHPTPPFQHHFHAQPPNSPIITYTHTHTDPKSYILSGPIIDTLEVDVKFGSITLEATDDPAATDIVIKVYNRALSKSALTKIAGMNASVIATPQNDTLNTVVFTSFVRLTSEGSNQHTGATKCRRSDVVITLPGKCLLDETNFDMRVDKGPIYVKRSMMDANVKSLNLQSGSGDISVDGAQSARINVNTTKGVIKANNMIGNVIFLLAIKDGSLIKVRRGGHEANPLLYTHP